MATVTDGALVVWSGTDAQEITQATPTGILKATGGVPSAAVAGTDYAASGSNPGYYATLDPWLSNLSAAAATANRAHLYRIPKLAVAKTITKLSVFIGGASGNLDLGIYTTTDFATFTRLGSSGSTAVAGTNAVQTVSGLSLAVPANVAWFLAVAADNATATFARLGSTSDVALKNYPTRAFYKASSFPLPSSLTSMNALDGTFSTIWWVVAEE